jgi:hypothetical protein
MPHLVYAFLIGMQALFVGAMLLVGAALGFVLGGPAGAGLGVLLAGAALAAAMIAERD